LKKLTGQPIMGYPFLVKNLSRMDHTVWYIFHIQGSVAKTGTTGVIENPLADLTIPHSHHLGLPGISDNFYRNGLPG